MEKIIIQSCWSFCLSSAMSQQLHSLLCARCNTTEDKQKSYPISDDYLFPAPLNAITGIAVLKPDGELSAEDFKSASKMIDPYIESAGKLKGIIIHVQTFPGWDSVAALISHFKFIKEHHKYLSHIALVTDSPVGGFAENIASHFISAEIKSFSFSELDEATKWILS